MRNLTNTLIFNSIFAIHLAQAAPSPATGAPTCDPSQLALTRDAFETKEEFADRSFAVISQLNAAATRLDVTCQAGIAHLNKAGYDIDTRIFPLEITWQPWTTALKLESKGAIVIPKNQARGLWKEGIEKPVFVLFDQLKETPTVDKIMLLGLQQQWEIKTEPTKPPEPERLPFEPEMVAIPAGSFAMGSDTGGSDEKPVHQVEVKAFKMSKYEATQAEWQAVMGNNPSNFSSCGERCPVEQVSWSEVQEYISKLNAKTNKQYRLPTEAEWEYACRGGVANEIYCGGDDINAVGWYSENSESKTHSVGQKQVNKFGLYDMSGNVWEWTCSVYVSPYNSSEKECVSNNHANVSLVIRGGSWVYRPRWLRSAYRDDGGPSARTTSLGFRLIRD